MGFFSYITQDTNESISNIHSDYKTFPVKMIDNQGNEYIEYSYNGYGVFGGKDYYELVAEMNGYSEKDEKRSIGFYICFGESHASYPEYTLPENPIFPMIVTLNYKDGWKDLGQPKDCPQQGFF
mgnify:CR=1 FL=1